MLHQTFDYPACDSSLFDIFPHLQDCLSSILVARDGFGDMAVSNAIGSNVFDINLGMGLPFLISICIKRGVPFMLVSQETLVS